MSEGCFYICVNLSTSLLPSTTECIVFRQVPAISWVDHTIECCVIIIKISVLVIILTPQFGKLLLEGLEYRSFDHHESGWSVEDFYKSIHDGSVLGTKVDYETGREHRHFAFVTLPDSVCSLIPHHNLFGITRNREVVSGFDKAHDCFWVEVNIGIYKHEIIAIRLLHETTDGHVTGAVDERFVFGRVEIHLDTFFY